VLLAYALGSIPFARLLGRVRFRRALRSLDRTPLDAVALERPSHPFGPASVLEAGAALLAATVAWRVTEDVAPGGGNISISAAIGVFSAQALLVWQSVALWAGFGAVVGNLGSMWLRFRGGNGLAPALALFFVFVPTVFAAGTGGFLLGLAATRRPHLALHAGLVTMLGYEWIAWIYDWPAGWGIRNGPETAVWVTVMAVLLAGRNLHAIAPADP
jgi:glycerol-3-phosphate acyltransferase PlsY